MASLPALVTTTSALWIVGRPVGQALPGLITELGRTGEWKPVAAALVALGLLAAPAPTLGLVRSLLGRVVPRRKE